MATSKSGQLWQTEVWDIVYPVYEDHKKKTPYTQDTYNYWNTLLKKDGLARAVLFNLAWLNPVASAIPNDEFSLPRAADAGKYYFYNKGGEPLAPEQWPLGKTITIGVLQKSCLTLALRDPRTTSSCRTVTSLQDFGGHTPRHSALSRAKVVARLHALRAWRWTRSRICC